jgi:hypothetical protein
MRDDAPPGAYKLASHYLLSDSRMKRRETSFRPYVAEVDARSIDIDLSLPALDCGPCEWYVPAALLPKGSVAPSLKVTDASGRVISIPTKRENMALTERAIEELSGGAGMHLSDPVRSRELIREVISYEPLPARVSRLVFDDHEPAASSRLDALLSLLEDQFLLWIPVHGAPASQHHLSISRHELRGERPIIRHALRPFTEVFPTALGNVEISAILAVGPRIPDFGVLLERFLLAFALRPLELVTREIEAARFASCHVRVHAPAGFLVRHIRAGCPLSSAEPGVERIVELDRDDPHVVVQGEDQNLGHMHLSQTENPGEVYLRVTLALRGGVTTLWMLAAVLTAGLLWLVHHHGSYGNPAEQNKQIAAAALLVGPAFASAWSLRAEGSELLRTSLSGARFLLLASAALSVASALALAGVFPSGSNRYEAIEIYASAGYLVAVPLIATWLVSSRPTWLIFRSFLRTRERSLGACAAIGLLLAFVGLHHGVPTRVLGGVLLGAGLALAAIAANPVGESLDRDPTSYRPLAGVAALSAVAIAGYFLGFYGDLVSEDAGRWSSFGLGVTLLLAALAGISTLIWGKWQEKAP